jgi:tetratricopeptide (TPR) repeat protein
MEKMKNLSIEELKECNELREELSKNNKFYYEEIMFEGFQVEFDMINNKEWDRLYNFRLKKAKLNYYDLESRINLAEVYILKKDYNKAVEEFKKLHEIDSENRYITDYLLESLEKLNIDFNKFDWKKKPIVVELNKNIMDKVFEYLKGKRKPIEIEDLMYIASDFEYTNFTRKEFKNKLKKDGRFEIIDNEYILRKKKR